ncbi:MAG: FAD-linked oxidase C-terminal domain-containing protein [Pirellulales bacterium]
MLAIFDSIDDATNTISNIIAAGIVPAALEMMDHGILGAASFHMGFPLDAQAILLIEPMAWRQGLRRKKKK